MFAHITDGTVDEVGPLPFSALRQDTLEEVHDLHGVNAEWRKACGWYSVDELDWSTIHATPEQVETITAAIAVAVEKQGRRQQAVQAGRAAANTAKDYFWDWLDHYSSLPVEGSPNAGVDWPALTTAAKAEALRDGVSGSLIWGIKVANALLLIVDVLQDLIADTDLEPPTEPGG